MKRLIWLGLTGVLLAGCGGAEASGGGAPTSAPASAEPSPTSPAAAIAAWWTTVKADFTTVGSDMGAISTDAGSGDLSAVQADCQGIISHVQALQTDPPFPTSDGNAHWQAALADFAKGGTQCLQGVSENDTSLINQASDDFTSGNGEVSQVTALVKQASGQ